MARNDGAQFWIVRGHHARNLGELGRIPGQSQNRQIGLVDRSVKRKVSDERGMSVEEDREPIFKRDKERCGRPAVGARRQGVVMRARGDLEGDAFHDELVTDPGAPELRLLEPVVDEPPSQRSGSEDRCPGQRRDFNRISHVIGVRVGNKNEISPRQFVQRNRTVRVGKPWAGDHNDAFGRGQSIELMAQPLNLDFPLLGRRGLGEPCRRRQQTHKRKDRRKRRAIDGSNELPDRHVISCIFTFW